LRQSLALLLDCLRLRLVQSWCRLQGGTEEAVVEGWLLLLSLLLLLLGRLTPQT
jgi:hypothetical protein